MYWGFDISVAWFQIVYTLVQMKSCIVGGVSIFKVPWFITSEVACLCCFVIQRINCAFFLKSSKVDLCEWISFSKSKWSHNVFFFGSNISKLMTHGKYNIHKKIKSVVSIHVSDKFDIWFWCFWKINCCIFYKVNSKWYWELLMIFFYCVWL